MKCDEFRYLMFDYVDQNLSDEVKQQMEAHINECSACAERMTKLQENQDEEKPTGLFWYLLRPSGGFKSIFFIGAICTFILVVALFYFRMRRP